MKKYILIIFSLVCIKLSAQQDPMNSMFAYNKLQTNPAYTGARDVLSMRALYRYQWVKIPGQPQTFNFNIHSPIKNERIALGLSLINDRLGVTNQNWLSASFAYRIPFNNDSKLSFGMSAGAYLYNVNIQSLEHLDGNDPILMWSFKGVNPIVGAGIYYYGDKYYVGIATPNLLPLDLKSSDNDAISTLSNINQVSHVFGMAGYTFEVGAKKNFWIQPQVLLKFVGAKKTKAPFQGDFNTTFTLYKVFNFGLTYRTSIADIYKDKESIDFMTMFDTKKGFIIAYAYDMTISKISNYDKGSHEVMMGYDINLWKKGVRTPRYF